MWLLVVSRSSDYWLGLSPHVTPIALGDVEVCLGIPLCVTRRVHVEVEVWFWGALEGGRPIFGSTGRGRPFLYPVSVFPTGSWILTLCAVHQYLTLSLEITMLRLRTVRDTHHLNAVSSTIRFATAYSATSIVLDSFKSFISIQLFCPSLHSTSSFQPRVVTFGLSFPLYLRDIPSDIGIAVWSFLWSTISLMNRFSLTSSSTCANLFSAIMLAAYFSIEPSVNLTSYYLVSKSGLLCTTPIGSPSCPRERLVTCPFCSFPDPTSIISS